MAMDEYDQRVLCPICREERLLREVISGAVLNDSVVQAIQARYPEWSRSDVTCTSCLANVVDDPPTDPSPAPAVEHHQGHSHRVASARKIHDEMLQRRTFGERSSDSVAAFVGSWTFVAVQVAFLLVWIAFNSLAIFVYHFDPYPFIFLNLVLSWIAALQAPLILMSQNRQDVKDRYRDENEYQTNLIAEREIRELQRKIDELINMHLPQLIEHLEKRQDQDKPLE